MSSFTPLHFLYSQFFVSIPKPASSFAGETVVITGSNSGIGKEAARTIVSLNAAKVILAVRNLKKGNDARDWILESFPSKGNVIEVWELDMASHESIKAFVKRLDTLDRIDHLIANAGVNTNGQPFSQTAGDETTMAINVVSTYLLVLLSLPALRRSGKKTGKTSTATITGSDVHYWAKFGGKNADSVFKWYADSKNYNGFDNYMDSKLLLILYMEELIPAMASSGKDDVIINMLTPGLCHSNLLGEEHRNMFMNVMMALVARSSEVGGWTIVDAAKKGKTSHGKFLLDARVRAPAHYVYSDEGKLKGRKVYEELNEKLEGIAPGVTKNI